MIGTVRPDGWGSDAAAAEGASARELDRQGSEDVEIIDRHFAAENAHDVAGTLATYTDDIVWDDITHPMSPFHGKESVGGVYSGIIEAIPDVHLESVWRVSADDGRAVVDESILTGHVHGSWSGIDGGGAPVRVRILHVFELRGGLIARENAWFNAADVVRQVEEWKSRPHPSE